MTKLVNNWVSLPVGCFYVDRPSEELLKVVNIATNMCVLYYTIVHQLSSAPITIDTPYIPPATNASEQ